METAERDQYSTVVEPQTTYVTRYVDQGGFEDQQIVRPGPVYCQKVCVPGGCYDRSLHGIEHVHRADHGLPQVQAPATVQVNRVYKPNIVAEQIPQTCYVQKVVVQKVPVQVCRMVTEEQVSQSADHRLPHGARRTSPEGSGPRSAVRSSNEWKTKCPCKPAAWSPKNRSAKCRSPPAAWSPKSASNKCRCKCCRMVAEEQTVRQPVCVEKRVPVTYTYRVPRTVVMKVPVDPCTGCAVGDARRDQHAVDLDHAVLFDAVEFFVFVHVGSFDHLRPDSSKQNRTPGPAPSMKPDRETRRLVVVELGFFRSEANSPTKSETPVKRSVALK